MRPYAQPPGEGVSRTDRNGNLPSSRSRIAREYLRLPWKFHKPCDINELDRRSGAIGVGPCRKDLHCC